ARVFFFSSRRRHTRSKRDWSSDVCSSDLAEVVDAAAARLRDGGTVHYFGAGTPGRLAVLDAAELQPTFSLEPGRVVAHIAGGARSEERRVGKEGRARGGRGRGRGRGVRER